jgi:hypothetical protein
MASTIKVNNIQNQCGANIANKCGTTITLGASGDTIQLAAGASQTGFGRTGTVDWDTTAKTASFTAVSGNGYFVNTTSGAITMTLPASPSAGDIVAVADYANTFATNNLTVARNGSLINGGAFDYESSTNGISLTFVYVDGTRGWKNVNDGTTNATGISDFIVATGGTITTCGNYKIHTFTGPGTFTVTGAGTPVGSNTVDYLVVAGGGGGGSSISGGAGAGGFRTSSGAASGCYTTSPLGSGVPGITVTASPYPITVGSGGAAAPNGGQGSNSIFSTITSAGGGRTGTYNGSGTSGGSGGGGSAGCSGTRPEGLGNTPPVSPPQGNPGGNSTSQNVGGGGGGASAPGIAGPGCTAVNGGDGSFVSNPFFGPTAPSYGETGPSGRYFSGGGGGGIRTPNVSPNSATAGLGGGGYARASNTGTDGTTNTGGGGGGGNYDGTERLGGSGGSGIVVIRYKYQ